VEGATPRAVPGMTGHEEATERDGGIVESNRARRRETEWKRTLERDRGNGRTAVTHARGVDIMGFPFAGGRVGRR